MSQAQSVKDAIAKHISKSTENKLNKNETSKETIRDIKTSELIQKLKINKSMPINVIQNLLLNDTLDKIFNSFLKNNTVKKIGENLYSFSNGKIFKTKLTKLDIIRSILESKKEVIMKHINIRLKTIKLMLKIENEKTKVNQINSFCESIEKQIKSQEKIKIQIIDKLNIKNREYLDASYKASKLELKIRSEIEQQQYHQANSEISTRGLLQGLSEIKSGLKREQLESNRQMLDILAGEAKIKAGITEQNLDLEALKLQTANHLAILDQDHEMLKASLAANRIESEKLTSAAKINNTMIAKIDDMKDLTLDMASRFNSLSEAFNDNTNLQIELGEQAQDEALAIREKIATGAENTKKILKNAGSGISSDIVGLNDTINDLNSGIREVGSSIEDINKMIYDLGNNIYKFIPPGCDPQMLPALGCGSNPPAWIMTPWTTTAINTRTNQTNISIYICTAAGHWCASDGTYGKTEVYDLNHFTNWTSIFDDYGSRTQEFYNFCSSNGKK